MPRTLCTCIAGVAVALFFGVFYKYHVYFQEQFQLFEFTWKYFADTVLVPGGLASWISRFLTQFFYHSAAGAIIIAFLLAAIQEMTFKLTHNFELSFVPAALMLIFLLSGEALLAAPVALLLSLCAAAAVDRVQSEGLRGAAVIAAAPVLYFLLGPLSLVFVLMAAVRSRGGKWWYHSLALLLFAGAILLSHKIFWLPYKRLLFNTGYYRFPDKMLVWPWLSVAAVHASALVGDWKKASGKLRAVIFAAVTILSVAGTLFVADFKREETMKYDFLARRGLWNVIINEARKKTPDTPNDVTCLNLALAMTGHLTDKMFDFFQCGTEGLMPTFISDYASSLPASEVYYYIGMVNTARRFTFASQENIPDGQHSARCYKRLAETNMLNGMYEASLLYLKPLTHTIFYKEWALEMMDMLGDEAAIEANPVFGFLRKSRLHEADFFFNRGATDSMLAFLIQENRNNGIAGEYLFAWLLLEKKVNELVEVFGDDAAKRIPAKYKLYYNSFTPQEGRK